MLYLFKRLANNELIPCCSEHVFTDNPPLCVWTKARGRRKYLLQSDVTDSTVVMLRGLWLPLPCSPGTVRGEGWKKGNRKYKGRVGRRHSNARQGWCQEALIWEASDAALTPQQTHQTTQQHTRVCSSSVCSAFLYWTLQTAVMTAYSYTEDCGLLGLPACSCISLDSEETPDTRGWCLCWLSRWTGGRDSCAASSGKTECSGPRGCTSCLPWSCLWKPSGRQPSTEHTAFPAGHLEWVTKTSMDGGGG